MIADPLANAPAFVPPQDALLQELGALCDELTANNQRSLGVRRSPFIVPDPVPVDIARDVALQICVGLRKYFAPKVDQVWGTTGITYASDILCGVVRRVLRFRGSWPGVSTDELVDNWKQRAGSSLYDWVRTRPGWAGSEAHCVFLVENTVAAVTGQGATYQREKRRRNDDRCQILQAIAALKNALVPGGAPAAPGGAPAAPVGAPAAPVGAPAVVVPAPVPAGRGRGRGRGAVVNFVGAQAPGN